MKTIERKMADRIQARAIRRCGELLQKIESAAGRPKGNRVGDRPISKTAAADDAGLSRHQKRTALRVARLPGAECTGLKKRMARYWRRRRSPGGHRTAFHCGRGARLPVFTVNHPAWWVGATRKSWLTRSAGSAYMEAESGSRRTLKATVPTLTEPVRMHRCGCRDRTKPRRGVPSPHVRLRGARRGPCRDRKRSTSARRRRVL